MTDLPILFSGPMVQAILEGRKTQTRRVLKTVKGCTVADYTECVDAPFGTVRRLPIEKIEPPKYAVGDRLWVRERFLPLPEEPPPADAASSRRASIIYAAGDGRLYCQQTVQAPAGYSPRLHNYGRWSPSIHMPRWASRLTLIVESARVERLQDISEDDAAAEGVQCETGTATAAFRRLWESINGAGSWAGNPWVAAITFTVERRNIDALPSHGGE